MTNDQQIIDFIAGKGKVRVVEIADKFDMELEDARSRTLALIESGDLVESNGFSPAGIACKVYDAKGVISASAVKTAPSFPAPVTRTIETPRTSSGSRSKADIAMGFILEKGQATSAELRDLLGLTGSQSASGYLASAIKSGRIIKDGQLFRAGDGKPIKKPAKTKGPAIEIASTETVTTEQAAPKMADFRIGLWSDGVIELQRNGVTVVQINQAERDHLMQFMSSVKIPAFV